MSPSWAFHTSFTIPSSPGDLQFFSDFTASHTSALDIGSSRIPCIGLWWRYCLTNSPSTFLSWLRMASKCTLKASNVSFAVLVHPFPPGIHWQADGLSSCGNTDLPEELMLPVSAAHRSWSALLSHQESCNMANFLLATILASAVLPAAFLSNTIWSTSSLWSHTQYLAFCLTVPTAALTDW